jgi:Coenzyme PQQ synthesis protein D (PqqD)
MNGTNTAWKHGRVRCADAVHARLFDEELVILDLARGEYFALDPVGARVWAGLQSGRTVEEMAQEIVSEYDVSLDGALADLTALGDDLVARGLLVRDDESGGGHAG